MLGELGVFLDLFSHPGFVLGLAGGLLAVGLLYFIAVAWRIAPRGWGLILAGVTTAVVALRFPIDPLVVQSLGAVVVGGAVVDLAAVIRRRGLRLAAKIGAWTLVGAASIYFTTTVHMPNVTWIEVAFPLLMVWTAAALYFMRNAPISDVTGLLVAASVVGVWVTVPETDLVRVLLGASLAMALATFGSIRARITATGAFAVAGVFLWLTLDGAVGRPEAILGGFASLGMIPLIPLMGVRRRGNRALMLGLHAVVLVVVTRIADMSLSIQMKSAATFMVLALSVAVLVTLSRMLGPEDDAHEPGMNRLRV